MAKSSNDLFATLRTYISKVTEGEKSPAEVAAALNGWARESAESIKAKVAEEVDAQVSKMGFIKRAEYEKLAARVEKLEKSRAKKSPAKKAAPKKPPTTAKIVKKSAAKKVTAKKASK